MIRKGFWIIFVFLVMGSLLYVDSTRFSVDKVTHPLPFHPEWSVEPLTSNEQHHLDQIFDQPFTYLGEGGQSFVFVSEDQHYVLKLFKFNRFRPSWFSGDKQKVKREQKMVAAFQGHKIAFDDHRSQSGLLAVQINPPSIPKVVILYDKWGMKHEIDLGSVPYILQARGKTLEAVFKQLFDKGDVAGVKNKIRSIFALYKSEYLKGIYDIDYGVMHNMGFIDEQPLHLDVGKFVRDEKSKNQDFYQADRIKIGSKIRNWVHKNYPAYEDEIVKELDQDEKN